MRPTFLLIAFVLLAACGSGQTPSTTTAGDDLPSQTATSTTVPATTSTMPSTTTTIAASTTTSSPSATSTTGAELPSVVIADGAVSGPESIEVTLGEEAVWEIRSDTAIEIHVHGYDLVYQLTPDETTEVRFLADVPGIFEVETHPGHQAVLEVVVEP